MLDFMERMKILILALGTCVLCSAKMPMLKR